MTRVKGDSRAFLTDVARQALFADRFEFVRLYVEHVDFTVGSSDGERRRRVRRPGHVLKTRAKVESHQALPARTNTGERMSNEASTNGSFSCHNLTVPSAEQEANVCE